jgi:phosphoribosylformimino-5-aminoimidazole carboxamide ribotide isomerase
MNPKPIIPVMDLMIGQIVLAQGGKRDGYRPVNSRLTRSSRPLDVAKAIRQQTGCNTLYLADIDSFAGAEPNWNVYRSLLDADFGLWIDADWLRENRLAKIMDRLTPGPQLRVIVSSETIHTFEEIELFADLRKRDVEPIFSLDQHGASVLSRSPELSRATPFEWVLKASSYGISEIIVLNLDRVGTMSGVDDDSDLRTLIIEISNELPQLRLISGGGVTCADDAASLLRFGCQHVLVASAIHGCKFTHDDIESLMALK